MFQYDPILAVELSLCIKCLSLLFVLEPALVSSIALLHVILCIVMLSRCFSHLYLTLYFSCYELKLYSNQLVPRSNSTPEVKSYPATWFTVNYNINISFNFASKNYVFFSVLFQNIYIRYVFPYQLYCMSGTFNVP